MAKEKEVRNVAANLAKLGIPVKLTKSRVEILKALVPPVQVPSAHS
ncbi:Lmo0850 family protein [Indiicoccus explosivorum]|nr:Lmo0850 family protein [Indiicoccus explosivorum]